MSSSSTTTPTEEIAGAAAPWPAQLADLLPLRALEITLRFLAPANGPTFHQPALTAFLRHLLGSPKQYDTLLTIDAAETGSTHHRRGDRYRFALYGLAGSEALLDEAIVRLDSLPDSAPSSEARFGANLVLDEMRDLWTGQTVRNVEALHALTMDVLDEEAALWCGRPLVRVRWRSPVRLRREKADIDTTRARGEARFCRSGDRVTAPLLANRLYDSFADLLRRRQVQVPPRPPPPALEIAGADLFWLDAHYGGNNGREQSMGGLSGVLEMRGTQALTRRDWWPWVLGQYVGIGQRRAFGWGRYRLERPDGQPTGVVPVRAASMLQAAAGDDNLRAAYRAIRENQTPRRWPNISATDDDGEYLAEEADESDDEGVMERLERLGTRLAAGRYEPAELRGVVIEKPSGDLRALAIPPFIDRVAQRAVAQVLSPGLETLMDDGSFGYRPGRSRSSARVLVERAYAEGYRWVYESDIDDFFDCVAWERLEDRLRAVYPDDPVSETVLRWMRAPVRYRGHIVCRSRGIPQGAPLSPLMANLLLDDFDTELRNAGFRLARFADDFVILCRSREEAQRAGVATQAALADIGLSANEEKTAIRAFSEGFRYLGYLFVGGLTLDVARNKTGKASADHRQVRKDRPRPEQLSGWLAALARREPQVLDPEQPTGRKSRAVVAASPKTPRPALTTSTDATRKSTIFVTGPRAHVATRGGRLEVIRDGARILSVPWLGIRSVVLLGAHTVTTPALRSAMSRGVTVHFATGGGRYQGACAHGGPGLEGHRLWVEQERLFGDPAQALAAARSLVAARCRHARETLRQRDTSDACRARLRRMKVSIEKVGGATSRASLHGIEGSATRAYFAGLRALVPERFGFDERNRRPPRDPFNALLSLGYAILYAHTETALRVAGLLPWTGVYHISRGRHAALASDLMEPFRHLVERAALNAVTHGLVDVDDFVITSTGGCILADDPRRRYLSALTARFELPVAGIADTTAKPLMEHLDNQNDVLIGWIRGRIPRFDAWRAR